MTIVQRLVGLVKWAFGIRIVRFGMVSVISALTALVILTIVYGGLRLWNEVESTLFANVLAGIPAYFLNRQWVWQKSGRSHVWREVVPYWTMSVASILFALLTSSIAQHYSDTHHLSHLARTIVIDGTNIASFGILWVLKFLLFNRLFAQLADAELGAEVASD